MKQRRVGTATLGLALIMIGILIPISLFYPEHAAFVMKLSPLILVALGVEVLIYVFWFRNEKLIYDGLSVFLVIVIAFFTVTGSLVSPIIGRVVEFNKQSVTTRKEVRSSLQKFMVDEKIDGKANVIFYRNGLDEFIGVVDNFENVLEDVLTEMSVNVDLYYHTEGVPDKTAIATDVKKILTKVSSMNYSSSVYFYIDVKGYQVEDFGFNPEEVELGVEEIARRIVFENWEASNEASSNEASSNEASSNEASSNEASSNEEASNEASSNEEASNEEASSEASSN